MRIRQGRRNKYNLYLMLGKEPSDMDPSIGYIRNARIAQEIVARVNGSDETVLRQSSVADASWERSEELRPDRLGPGPDLPIRDETRDEEWRRKRELDPSSGCAIHWRG